ncbi:MAG: 2Fe-2S iron-sulfur cluster-binding protein [Acidobacteriota bacterium]
MSATWREGLFEKFDSLVQIMICEARAEVPENNKLLRCFQFIRADTVSMGDYCWNGECANCRVWYESPTGETKSALACRMYVEEGLVITRLSDCLRCDLE